jgi:hypothetical protein
MDRAWFGGRRFSFVVLSKKENTYSCRHVGALFRLSRKGMVIAQGVGLLFAFLLSGILRRSEPHASIYQSVHPSCTVRFQATAHIIQ